MKKIWVPLLLALFVLSACNAKLSVSQVESVPKDLEKLLVNLNLNLKPNDEVQLINTQNNTRYIVVKSGGDITLEAEDQGDTVLLNLKESNVTDEVIKQYIFKLSLDRDYEFLELLRNGKETPVHSIVGL